MDFIGKAAQNYLHHGQSGQAQGGQGYPPPQQEPQGYQDPNYGLPPGWIAEWDAPDNRWFYVNTHTGERTWNRPGAPPSGSYQQAQAPAPKNHNMVYGAAGAAGGLLAGAVLMHEGEKVEEHWKRDEEKWKEDFEGGERREEYGYGGGYGGGRPSETIIENNTYVNEDDRYGGGYGGGRGDETIVENTYSNDDNYGRNDRYDQETIVRDDYRRDDYQDDNLVDDAARWTGRKVQEVEDFPEDAARWTGEKVQEVEDIPEDIDNAYDEGRYERREYDDDRY